MQRYAIVVLTSALFVGVLLSVAAAVGERLLVLLFSLFVVASPASAMRTPPGVKLDLMAYPGQTIDWPADTPFFIRHGWGTNPGPERAKAKTFAFELEIDGVYRDYDYTIKEVRKEIRPGFLVTLWVREFADGMPQGQVTFTGHWLCTCEQALDNDLVDACDDPLEVGEYYQQDDVGVNFVP